MITTNKEKAADKDTKKKAVTKKKVATKKAVKAKASTKKVTPKKTAVKKKATSKKATIKPQSKTLDISSKERWRMISIAAYHKAEKRNFTPGHELQDWVEAEQELNQLLKD